MDWLWLLHDDCAPEPEALERLLAEAESRPSASILGPKLVSWTNPDRLQEIGSRSTGRAGRCPRSRTTRSTRASTTRSATCSSSTPPGCWSAAGALLNVGGFDERMPAFRDDLDLCWRTHLTGGRVLVVPQAGSATSPPPPPAAAARAVGHPAT